MNRTLLIATLVAASVLTACGQRDEMKPAERADGTAATRPNDTTAMGQTPQARIETAPTGAGPISDAVITTKINAALAADDSLKALRIDVDTKDGQVTLSGTAPDANALSRATVLVQSVDGVRGVANRLVVASKG